MQGRIIKSWTDGAKITEISPGVEVGTAADGRVYKASDAGWDWVFANARTETQGGGTEFYVVD